MSTYINDLRSSAVVAAGLHPTTISVSTNAPAVDLTDGDGPCFAIQLVGDLEESGTLDGRIEQSADGTTWDAIPGAVFAEVDGAQDVQVIRFERTMRYLRWASTVAGDDPVFTVAVAIGSLKKTF
jgi:hypothetical protein